jgi:hypothetical protein
VRAAGKGDTHLAFCLGVRAPMADEEGGPGGGDAAFEAALAAREADVDALLRGGKASDALQRALQEAPFASKSAPLKDRNAAVVQRALVAAGAKEDVLLACVASLDPEGADALMKYVVRLLGVASANTPLFLKLHGLLVEKCGLGCLVRCIVDRRTA